MSGSTVGTREVVGILSPADNADNSPAVKAIVAELSATPGCVPEQDIELVMKFANFEPTALDRLAQELVSHPVDIIVATNTQAIRAAKKATMRIPIVMAVTSEHQRLGLVLNPDRPEGNVTGVSDHDDQQGEHMITLVTQLVPRLRRLAVLYNASNPAAALDFAGLQMAATPRRVLLIPLDIRKPTELNKAFQTARAQEAQALVVLGDAVTFNHTLDIIALAKRYELPTLYGSPQAAERGGLMGSGPNHDDLWRRGAQFVAKILPLVRAAKRRQGAAAGGLDLSGIPVYVAGNDPHAERTVINGVTASPLEARGKIRPVAQIRKTLGSMKVEIR